MMIKEKIRLPEGNLGSSFPVESKPLRRFPVVEDLFYPEDPAGIEAQFRAWGLERSCGKNAAAIIAPHGAWGISGRIAADAFFAAGGRDSISRVFILGPIHNGIEEGIFLSDSDFFETPLGPLPVDHEMENELSSCSTLFEVNDIPHLSEHSIEVLLPFIKYCFPHASIVPILMGSARQPLVSALARALEIAAAPIMEKSLCVVSCNLAINTNKSLARTQAEECVKLLLGKDAAAFSAGVAEGRVSTCGNGLAASLLESGLLANREAHLLSSPLISAKGEENQTVYYGALSYE
jgi:AmmeMemoRadiSam system protein B